jgi:hypothetical protein
VADCVEVLETAIKALLTKIKLANDGATRGKNITLEEINRHAMKSLRQTESGMVFWRDFVHSKSWIINTQRAAFYLKQYIIEYNS